MKLDRIDRLYERKKFLKIIFDKLGEKEHIRIFQCKDDFNKVTFWNNIDDLNEYIEKNIFSTNTYFNLATTDGQGGTVENLLCRYCLAWDFDKKLDNSIDAKEIMFRFNSLKIYYHAIIDSGYGFHVYMCINKTNDLKMVEEVSKAIGNLLGADPKAMLQTQILRVPHTFNFKDGKREYVNIIHQYPKETIKRYDIEALYKRFCNKINKEPDDRTTNYVTSQTNFPPCVLNLLNGVDKGNRNFALMRLISFMKLYKYNKAQTWNVIKEWNVKNKPPIKDKELESKFNYSWEKKYICCGCITNNSELQIQLSKYCDKEKCRSSRKSDVYFVAGETLQMEYKICKKLEKQQKNLFQIKGNHLLIICILKNDPEGLNTKDFKNKLTYEGKCCLSDKTISKVLQELTDNGYITRKVGNKRKKESDFYKINEIKCEEMEKFNLNYSLLLGVLYRKITTEDFKVYCYMRYRLQKGLSLSQEKLADELGIGQPVISKHIKKLIDAKYIEFKGVSFNNNIYGNNEYRLNC